MHDLHGVFAYTVFGDRIRVSHYESWGEAIDRWNWLDQLQRSAFNGYKSVSFFCVRSWDDPDWNTARYRSLESVRIADKECGAMQ